MDRGQTFDVVDTPPPDRPSSEDFEEREEILKWRAVWDSEKSEIYVPTIKQRIRDLLLYCIPRWNKD